MTNGKMTPAIAAALVITTMAAAQRIEAQTLNRQPAIVVSVTIDHLTTADLERYSHLLGSDGFRRLINEGTVYSNAVHTFAPADRTAALTAITTGTTPYYNGITARQRLDRATLRPVNTIADDASTILSSTITDELKIATGGKAIVYSVADDRETAIILAGHCADGALYTDGNGTWKTNGTTVPAWLTAYNRVVANQSTTTVTGRSNADNDCITDMAAQCAASACMGIDAATDMLTVAYSVDGSEKAYIDLDRCLARLIGSIEKTAGEGRALFIVSGTGSTNNDILDYKAYNIPTGTFYINRTQDLLNMYLGALYGQARYVEAAFDNQLFLNRKLMEQRKMSFNDVLALAKAFILQLEGVRSVYSGDDILNNRCPEQNIVNAYNPAACGDIIVEVLPGWTLLNEQTNHSSQQRPVIQPFPIMILGGKAPRQQKSAETVAAEQIAPTIAGCLNIRAPNACNTTPLF